MAVLGTKHCLLQNRGWTDWGCLLHLAALVCLFQSVLMRKTAWQALLLCTSTLTHCPTSIYIQQPLFFCVALTTLSPFAWQCWEKHGECLWERLVVGLFYVFCSFTWRHRGMGGDQTPKRYLCVSHSGCQWFFLYSRSITSHSRSKASIKICINFASIHKKSLWRKHTSVLFHIFAFICIS